MNIFYGNRSPQNCQNIAIFRWTQLLQKPAFKHKTAKCTLNAQISKFILNLFYSILKDIAVYLSICLTFHLLVPFGRIPEGI